MSKVNPRLHTPVGACVGVALLAAIPFIQFAGATVIAVSATAMIYLSYLLGNWAILRARLKGWPRTRAPFALGNKGKLVNALALLWGAAMLVNFLWFTDSPDSLRVLTNPKATQTDYGNGQLVNFHIGFLNKIPVIELLMVTVVLIGAIYYFTVQRNKPFTPVRPPDEELEAVAAAPVA